MTTFSLTVALALAVSAARPSAVVFGDHLLVADGDGTVRAWKHATLEFDAAQTKKLNGDGLLAVVKSDGTLWGFDGVRAFTWDPNGARWDLVKGKPPPSPCRAFAIADGKPVGVCGAGVHRFTDGKYWDAPEFKGQISGRGFSDTPEIASRGSVVAIGTGYGEWGGHLFLLDVTSGTWNLYTDTLGNCAGIVPTEKGWFVAWSMSHMMAHTRARLHGADGKPLLEGPMLRDRYLRALTWGAEANAVIGLEQNDLVKLSDTLGLEKVQSKVGQVRYGDERNAVGVSPGIGAFLAIGGGRYVIVPTSGPPLVVGGAKSVSLVAPAGVKPDAGR